MFLVWIKFYNVVVLLSTNFIWNIVNAIKAIPIDIVNNVINIFIAKCISVVEVLIAVWIAGIVIMIYITAVNTKPTQIYIKNNIKYLRLRNPIQLLTHGQWWSIFSIHLPHIEQWCALYGLKLWQIIQYFLINLSLISSDIP